MHKYLLKIKRFLNKPQLNRISSYNFLVFIVILIAILVRFYNFPERWGISADGTRDAMIALQALSRHQLPLMGPFSSAGAFVTGGIYYWLIMLSFVLFPFLINAPWLMTGLISVLNVGLLMYLGKILIDKRFSLILGILGAFSPIYVASAIELGNPNFVTVFAILNLIFFVLLLCRKRLIFAFLSGLSIGLAISMHYQALNLLVFPLVILFVTKLSLRQRVKAFGLMLIGIIIISLPLFAWDYHQGFANTRNILDYFLIGQYRIYVPNSWRLFLFSYLPAYWANVAGRFSVVGLILLFSSIASFIIGGFRKRLSLPLLFTGIIFFILLVLNKFYKGERTDSYMFYLAPFILIFTAYLIYFVSLLKQKIYKFSSILILVFLLSLNFLSFRYIFTYNNKIQTFENISQILISRFPNEKFSLYDSRHENYRNSMPLSLLLSYENKIDQNGKKIGVDCKAKDCPGKMYVIIDQPIKIIDMSTISSARLDPKKGIWANVNPAFVYDNQVGWLNKYQLKSTFSLKNYIIGKIRLL